MLRVLRSIKKNLWVEMRKFLTAYRTTPHSTTGVTPTKLLFNREVKERSKIPDLLTARQETRMQRRNREELTMLTKEGAAKKRTKVQVVKS